MSDISEQFIDRIEQARQRRTPLSIVGGNTKAFLGRRTDCDVLPVANHSGLLHYEPRELVVTARGGTPLSEIEAVLAAEQQMLPFEPPRFGAAATIAGTVAANMSGPRRPWSGSARDAVLGIRLITGRAEHLQFGGRVMKNVAGFDISRLLAGSFGCLGLITEISLKVMPRPEAELTLVKGMGSDAALTEMTSLARQAKPLTGAAWLGGRLHVRLQGSAAAVAATREAWGGDELANAEEFWSRVRDLELDELDSGAPLWRWSVKPTAPLPDIAGRWLIDWAGGQRFVAGDFERHELETFAAGGHITMVRGGDRGGEVYSQPPEALKLLQQRLKAAFDPDRILNPGRMFGWL